MSSFGEKAKHQLQKEKKNKRKKIIHRKKKSSKHRYKEVRWMWKKLDLKQNNNKKTLICCVYVHIYTHIYTCIYAFRSSSVAKFWNLSQLQTGNFHRKAVTLEKMYRY